MHPELNYLIARHRIANVGDDDLSVACVTLHSHHLAKLDRFIVQARRRATRSGGQFAGVAVQIAAAGTVTVHAAGMEPLVL